MVISRFNLLISAALVMLVSCTCPASASAETYLDPRFVGRWVNPDTDGNHYTEFDKNFRRYSWKEGVNKPPCSGAVLIEGDQITNYFDRTPDWSYDKIHFEGETLIFYGSQRTFTYTRVSGGPIDDKNSEQCYSEANSKATAGKTLEGVAWMICSAQMGNPTAGLVAGRFFANRGFDGDYQQAAYWYERAANGGNSDAMYNLGALYEGGWGMQKNTATAQQWYQKAAKCGNQTAINKLKAASQGGSVAFTGRRMLVRGRTVVRGAMIGSQMEWCNEHIVTEDEAYSHSSMRTFNPGDHVWVHPDGNVTDAFGSFLYRVDD